MARFTPRHMVALGAAVLMVLALVVASPSAGEDANPLAGIGVDPAELSPVVSNPHMAFGTLKRAVYLGKERDPETGKAFRIRMEWIVRDSVETKAGIKVMVVESVHHADDELVERSRDYFAQDRSGAVRYLGQDVDDYDGGKIIGHDGQWLVGEHGSKAGLLMPAAPKVGDVFEQERVPGVAQNRSKVLAVGRTIKVPAGTFKNCIEVEMYDSIEKSSERKWFCSGVGLVKESSAERTIELTERVTR